MYALYVVGFLLAIRAWRPERGPFPAFAEACVKNHALLAVTAASRRKHQVLSLAISLEQPTAPGGRGQLMDQLESPRDARTDPEMHMLVREEVESVLHAVPSLTVREQTALSAVLSGESYERLAQRSTGRQKPPPRPHIVLDASSPTDCPAPREKGSRTLGGYGRQNPEPSCTMPGTHGLRPEGSCHTAMRNARGRRRRAVLAHCQLAPLLGRASLHGIDLIAR
jgi:hypothetical protein